MKWEKLSDDDLDRIAGGERFVSTLQEAHGLSREEAQKSADEWLISPTEERTTDLSTASVKRS